jgi:hypothetical protein
VAALVFRLRAVLDEWWRELRLACRSLRATPVAAAVAIVSLALGIGANTAIFSLINGLLLRALPVKDPARLVLLTDTSPDHVRVWSYAVGRKVEQRSELFASSAAWSFTRFNLASSGEARLVDGMWASGSFFDTLAAPALLGRTFSEYDDRSAVPLAVIGYRFWQRHFGGSREAIGRPITFDGVRSRLSASCRRPFPVLRSDARSTSSCRSGPSRCCAAATRF